MVQDSRKEVKLVDRSERDERRVAHERACAEGVLIEPINTQDAVQCQTILKPKRQCTIAGTEMFHVMSFKYS